jgi:hypothetical protein
MKQTFALLLAALTTLPLAANPISAGIVLVPITPGTVSGAFGSQWVTRLTAHNPADADARIACDGALDTCPLVAAHQTAVLDAPYAGLKHPGFFLETRSKSGFFAPPDVWLELRTLDVATAPQSAGTEVPLPGLDEFRTGTIVFPDVPFNGHSHVKLRIYTLSSAAVAVRTYAAGQLVSATTVGATGEDPTGQGRYPAYAELDIVTATGDAGVRVELDSAVPAWAFLSVTDDVSRQFTIVSPHLPPLRVLSVA